MTNPTPVPLLSLVRPDAVTRRQIDEYWEQSDRWIRLQRQDDWQAYRRQALRNLEAYWASRS